MASGSSNLQIISTIGILSRRGDVNVAGNVTVNVQDSSQKKLIELHEFKLPRLINTFRGRDEELKQLDALFFVENAKKVVISGLPGMGKSELAKQFADQCKKDGKVDHIFWIKAENKEELEKLCFKFKNLYKNVIKKKCLFVFDNTVDRQSIFNVEPPDEENYHLLMTSQTKDLGDDVKSFSLKEVKLDAAIEIFKAVLTNTEKYYALYVEIANIVNNIPLGLQVTAAYVRQRMKLTGQHFDLQDYVDEIKQNQDEYIDKTIPKNTPNPYSKSLYGAIQISINKLKEEENLLALNALFICAFLDPERIAIDDLLTMPNIEQQLTHYRKRENKLREALGLIDNYSLIRFSPDGSQIEIHRLIQEILRRHQRDIQSDCYNSCLGALFNYSNLKDSEIQYNYYKHIYFLKYADNNVETFIFFYQKHKNELFLNQNGRLLLERILYRLMEWKCIESFKNLLDEIHDHNIISRFDLLHAGACYNNLDLIKMLVLEYNFNVNCTNSRKETPIHIATEYWNYEAINYFVELKADVNSRNSSDETPLFSFIRSGQFHQHFKLDEVNNILNILNLEENQHNTNKLGYTLMHATAASCNADLVSMMVTNCKLNVNARGEIYGGTPLHALVDTARLLYPTRDHVIQTVEALKSCGARLDLTDSQGKTPWQVAQEHEKTKYLLSHLIDCESASEYEPASKKFRDD